MGTIFHSDNSGLFALMVGLIALVMFGVLVTLLMDGSVELPQGEDLQIVYQTGEARKKEATKRREFLLEKKAQRVKARGLVTQFAAKVKVLDERINKLSELRSELKKGEREYDRLQVKYDDYKSSYCANLRRQATGREIEILTTTGGRVYHKLKITELNKMEMRFVHQDGPAKILVTELPSDLLKEYQLDPAEAGRLVQELEDQIAEQRRKFLAKRAALAKAEKERMEKEEERAGRLGPKGGRRGEVDDETRAKIQILDAKLKLMHSKFGALQRELANAEAKIGGAERSPPGSLQTWEERAVDLNRWHTRALAAIRSAEDELKILNPRYRPPRLPQYP